MKTIEDLIEYSSIPESLIRAVVEQIGGWEEFTERAPEVAAHGADSGFSGFTLYADTVKFYTENRPAVLDLVKNGAVDMETGLISFICEFRCLKGTYDAETSISATLYGPQDGQDFDLVAANALAWYALEEVSSAYVDMLEA